jgi:hypothetical protein
LSFEKIDVPPLDLLAERCAASRGDRGRLISAAAAAG